MKKWIVYWDAGMPGTDCYESCLAETQDEAEKMFHDAVYDWFDSFDQSQGYDEDDSDEQEADEAQRRSEVSAYAEEYNPDEHEGYRCGNSKWAWE